MAPSKAKIMNVVKGISRHKNILFLLLMITALGAIPRLLFLSQYDFYGDDALYAMRSIGYFDFFDSANQQSPVQRLENEQWWQTLSFHDHPPLTFFVQHIFFKLFGDTMAIARLPYALIGIFSIPLMYAAATKLYNYQFGLLSAALLAASNFHLWTSRLNLLETFIIFFSLLALWLTLKALEDQRYLIAVGACIGLALISKYNALFLIPLVITILLFSKRNIYKSKWFLYGVYAFLLTISPVILYNLSYYQATGHFDSTLSLMLGMHPEDFQGLTQGYGFFKTLVGGFVAIARSESPLFLFGSLAGLILLFLERKNKKIPKIFTLTLIAYLLFLVMTFFGQASARHVSLIIPAIVLLAAFFLLWLYQKITYKPSGVMMISALVAYFLFIGLNTQVLAQPIGVKNITYLGPIEQPITKVYYRLENYAREFFQTQRVPLPLQSRYTAWPQVLEFQFEQTQKYLAQVDQSTLKSGTAFVFYDQRIEYNNERWIFLRRQIYQGRPVGSLATLTTNLEYNPNYFKDSGFDTYYFIFINPSINDDEVLTVDVDSERFRQMLIEQGYQPVKILKDTNGNELFIIFKTNSLSFVNPNIP